MRRQRLPSTRGRGEKGCCVLRVSLVATALTASIGRKLAPAGLRGIGSLSANKVTAALVTVQFACIYIYIHICTQADKHVPMKIYTRR